MQLIRVLIVDRDARVLTALRTTIDPEPDLVVIGAVSGAAAALAVAVEAAPFVALVDVPVYDDAGALLLVRSLSRMPGGRVVAMSFRGGLRVAAHVAGAAAFVEKGEDVEAMLSAIRDVGAPTA